MAKLKVFKAQMGFYESVVAAPSQKAALAAWGTHQDLFGAGMAAITDDAAAVKAATAQPGVVLKRPAGGKGAFEADGAALPKVPPAPKKPKGAKAKPPAKPKPADRTALTEAERALKAVEDQHAREQAALDQARRELDTRAFDLERAHRARLKAAEGAVDKARRAYEAAGGE